MINGVTVYKGNKGGSIRDTFDTVRASNPLIYINKNTPPFLIMHGNADKTISPSQSKILYDALIKNGVDATY
ncbi:MAG: prolyl oligopeptidase family serine peptidase [Selenomonadaceae bacterium]|nr:prolyl oligopeptidase family serine peptidase [Selenomonadaceae bacterium]MBQ6130957.1 prolyl oligopeptidase family serine peptidase [Selenomonadaceae bacterium]